MAEDNLEQGLKYLEQMNLHGAVAKWREDVIIPRLGTTPSTPAIEGMRNGFGLGCGHVNFEPQLQLQLYAWGETSPTPAMEVSAHALRVRVMMMGLSGFAVLRILGENAMKPQNVLQMRRIYNTLLEAEALGQEALSQLTQGEYSLEKENILREKGLELTERVALELASPLTRSNSIFANRSAVLLVFSLLPEVKDGELVTEPLDLKLTPGEIPAVTFAAFTGRISPTRFSLLHMLMGEICAAVEEYHPDLLGLIPPPYKPWDEFLRDEGVRREIAELSREDACSLMKLLIATSYPSPSTPEDAWNMMAAHLESLTIDSLVELGRLVEEYNEEWAIAAFDWGE